jgi:peptidoglycan/xylan/chitin deacetylase (PgdA/CDA1 family)
VNWNVDTEKKLIALTFDDGPLPDWTPMVHDALDAADVPATFFFVGKRLEAHGDLIRNRMRRHEAANHTWAHVDLSTLADDEVLDAIRRTHDTIDKVLGQQARHLRPPYGHLGGSTLLAAADLGYDITLWSLQMIEWEYLRNPAGHVAYIVGAARPGTILLAHDVGQSSRLVTLKHLPEIVAGLRARGFSFVTVSGLLKEQSPPTAALISDHVFR